MVSDDVEKNTEGILDDHFQCELDLKDGGNNVMNYFEVFALFDMERSFYDSDHAAKRMLMEGLAVHSNIVLRVMMS